MKRYTILGLAFFVFMMFVVSVAGAAPKGKLVIGFPGEPTTYDPHTRTGGPMSQMWPMVFDTLLWRKASGEIVGNVASSWKQVNPKLLELKIRKGIKFHNGEVLDAHAVKYSLDRIFEPKLKSRVKNFIRTIKNVEVVDDYTVRIHTKSPDGFLLAPLADWGSIVPPKHYKSKTLKHLARYPVGSGPYKVVKWKKGSEIIYEAFPGYWNPARQKFKTGIVKFIPESTTRVAALVSGAVDMVTGVPPQMTSMVKANPKYEAISYHGPKACSIIMVLKDDVPWTKLKVRQAVNYGIDKESIIKHVLLGYAIPSKGTIVGPKSFGHNPDLKPYLYDLAKAKRLMKEAGYEKGFTVPLMVPIGRYLGGEKAAEAIAGIIPEDTLSEEHIVPSVFDRQVVQKVSRAVAKAARETGVARRQPRVGGVMQPD